MNGVGKSAATSKGKNNNKENVDPAGSLDHVQSAGSGSASNNGPDAAASAPVSASTSKRKSASGPSGGVGPATAATKPKGPSHPWPKRKVGLLIEYRDVAPLTAPTGSAGH